MVELGSSSASPRRGRAPGHSRQEIAAAAIEVADSEGLGSVTMRSVALALGTGAASLYRYFSTRDELLALMVDEVTGELRLNGPDDRPWVDQMLDLAHDARDLYRRHPWMIEASSTAPALGPNGCAYLEHALAVLAPTRSDGGTMLEAVAVFSAVTRLLSKEEHDRRDPGEAHAALAPSTDSFPHLAAALADTGPSADQFDRVLRRVLSGLLPNDR
ncbi:TetR/AcrR family transcriptional regulator [Promicromonospora sp. NPDC023805]|uniref:TetR/AcrR family transcriptional regulator n=1 Tax=Promicromonospora sp. NPDC023805 TaxID=3154696 RepID=UPI0033CB6CD4